MQKVINVLAVLSFLGTATIVGGGAYVYLNREAIIEDAKEKVTAAATEAITSVLPGMVEGLLPEIPEVGIQSYLQRLVQHYLSSVKST